MNILICGGVFYGQTTAKPKRPGRGRCPFGKRYGRTIAPAYTPGCVPDSGRSAAGKFHTAFRSGVRRGLGAYIGMCDLWEEKGRIRVCSALCSYLFSDLSPGRCMYSDECMGFWLRFKNAVRYDSSDDDCVFHKNEQK